jgi:hypothetical protein
MTGLVLNNVLWLINTCKPFGKFSKAFFQSIGLEPTLIALNILPKVTYERPNAPIAIKIKMIFSMFESILINRIF